MSRAQKARKHTGALELLLASDTGSFTSALGVCFRGGDVDPGPRTPTTP